MSMHADIENLIKTHGFRITEAIRDAVADLVDLCDEETDTEELGEDDDPEGPD